VSESERLSDATRAMVVDVDATWWSGLAARIARRRRVLWLVAVSRVAAMLLIALAVSALMGRNSSSVGLAHARRSPARMVAVTYDGRLLLVSSRDGHAVRTIASDAFAEAG
jgi:hypothetical protein